MVEPPVVELVEVLALAVEVVAGCVADLVSVSGDNLNKDRNFPVVDVEDRTDRLDEIETNEFDLEGKSKVGTPPRVRPGLWGPFWRPVFARGGPVLGSFFFEECLNKGIQRQQLWSLDGGAKTKTQPELTNAPYKYKSSTGWCERFLKWW